MIGILFDIINFISMCCLGPFVYIETIFCKKIFIFNNILKNQIIRSGPVPIKIAQFIINYKKIEHYDNKLEYLTVYNDLFNNVYKNKITESENYTFLNSGSICNIYINKNNNTILKRLHYKSIDSVHFYLYMIKHLFYFFSIPLDYNDFKTIFLNQFCMKFESSMHQEFYNNIDNKLIKIPKIIKNNDSEIIMEYLPSKSFTNSNLSYINTTKYAQILCIFFKHMYLENGLIHLDIHDGNWGLTEDGIVVYDFGYSLKLFDPNDIVEKKIYYDLLFYNWSLNSNELTKLIFSHFVTPKINDYTEFYKKIKNLDNEYDRNRLLFDFITYCKKYNLKIHINLYYILHSMTILRCMYDYIFQNMNSDLNENKVLTEKLIHENAILYKRDLFKNVTSFNKQLIHYINDKDIDNS